MQSVTDIDLPSLPVERPEFAADPFPFLEAARRQHPWLAKFDSGYVVHGYQAAKDLLVMDENLAAGFSGVVDFYDAQDTLWGKFLNGIVLSKSGATHARMRASVAKAFTPQQANRMRPAMRKVISDLLDEWAPKGEFDFAQFAAFFPIAVMCALLGVSAEPIPRIRAWLDTHMSSLTLNRDLKPSFLPAFDKLWDFVDQLVLEREKSGMVQDNSLLDNLIAAKKAGDLDETELRVMVLTLLVAGYDTSKNQLTMTMYRLLDRPDMWVRCANDQNFCAKVIEEVLRHSAIASPFRTVAQEFVYDGVLFPKGTLLAMALPLTGRDPAVFANPNAFDPESGQKNRHLAFGTGIHFCLGMHIARTQIEEGLHLIAQRITNPRLAGEITWRPFIGGWSPKSLPISFAASEHHHSPSDLT